MPRLEHIGLAVSDAAAVEALYKKLFGYRAYKSEDVAAQGVRTVFLSAASAKLELLEALTEDSPIAKHLTRRGEGLHHLAFEVDHIDAELERVRALGFTVLSDAPLPGADGKRIFFLHPRDTHGVLVEFCQQTPQRLAPQYIPFLDGTLAGYTLGSADAPPVLLLHGGLGSTHLELLPLMRALEGHCFVMAFDLAGHGASTVPPSSIDRSNWGVTQVEAVLDFYQVPRAALFGFSMGGTMALHTALARRERVTHLALVGVNTTWDAPTLKAAARRIDPDFIERYAPAWAGRLAQAHGTPRWQNLARKLRDGIQTYAAQTPTPTQLATLTLPTLVGAGDRDRIYPLDHTLALYRSLPDSQFLVCPGAAHDLRQFNARWLADALQKRMGEL